MVLWKGPLDVYAAPMVSHTTQVPQTFHSELPMPMINSFLEPTSWMTEAQERMLGSSSMNYSFNNLNQGSREINMDSSLIQDIQTNQNLSSSNSTLIHDNGLSEIEIFNELNRMMYPIPHLSQPIQASRRRDDSPGGPPIGALT